MRKPMPPSRVRYSAVGTQTAIDNFEAVCPAARDQEFSKHCDRCERHGPEGSLRSVMKLSEVNVCIPAHPLSVCTFGTNHVRGYEEFWMREDRGHRQGNSRQKESTLSGSNLQPRRPLIPRKFFPLAGML